MITLNFGQAIEAAKQGKQVARKGWNGKDQFVFLVQGADLVKSIKGKHLGCLVVDALAIKTTSNQVQIGWLASQADMLASDWEVVE